MKVLAIVKEIELEGDYVDSIPSICVTCSRCDHSVKVYGQELASVRRGMIMLREGCPMGESNFYEKENT